MTYASSNPSVATVSETGLITAVKPLHATITVTTTDGTGISKTILVIVKQLAESITLDKESVAIEVGAEFSDKVTATVLPSNTSNNNLKWTSADPTIATVSAGTITGVSSGTTTVTATTTDGSNISKTINVTVLKTYKNGIMESLNNCINVGTCPNGTVVRVAVNDQQSYKFYTMKDDGATLTLLMGKALGKPASGDPVAWYADATDNSYGPITAINYLDELTDEEWDNVPKREYTYSGIGSDEKTRMYDDITRTMRARMITYGETNTIKIQNNNTMPSWMYDDNTTWPRGHWTSTADVSNSGNARFVNGSNGFVGSTDVTKGLNHGVRPVIELSK